MAANVFSLGRVPDYRYLEPATVPTPATAPTPAASLSPSLFGRGPFGSLSLQFSPIFSDNSQTQPRSICQHHLPRHSRRSSGDANASSSPLDSYLSFLSGHSIGLEQLRSLVADENSPMSSLPDPPAVSLTTVHVTGILVDVYGLEELPSNLTHVSVLWLHNPRMGDKSTMAPMAKRVVAEYNNTRPSESTRGLIAAAFDQRNHGSREVNPISNQSWKKGNPHHAQDMFGMVSGTVSDTRLLIDALPGYLFLDSGAQPEFDQNIVLGISLGGHSAWQTIFTEPRVTAGVSIIGCPDFQYLMKDRARMSKLSTYDADTNGASFLGSRDFPPALVRQCAQFDPKGIVFGTDDVVELPSEDQQTQLRPILDRHVKGKKFMMTTGGDDKLVPWRCSESFTKFFTQAAETWYKDSGLILDNKIYSGAGHECSDEMVLDAVKFVCDVVKEAQASAVVTPKI